MGSIGTALNSRNMELLTLVLLLQPLMKILRACTKQQQTQGSIPTGGFPSPYSVSSVAGVTGTVGPYGAC